MCWVLYCRRRWSEDGTWQRRSVRLLIAYRGRTALRLAWWWPVVVVILIWTYIYLLLALRLIQIGRLHWKSFVFSFFPLTLLYLLFGPTSHAPSLWQIDTHTLRSLTNSFQSLCPEVPTTSPPLQFLFYDFTPCVRIHWSFYCCALQRSVAVLICQLFPFVVWIATTTHSVQSSRTPSVDIGNNLSFIIFY